MRDFTHNIYKKLLTILKDKSYQFISVNDYFTSNYNTDKPFIMIRHDVDRYPLRSLAMAKLEYNMSIKATYYFRTIPQTYKPIIINEISKLGHEIGYHYESLAETQGDYSKAIRDFEKNLNKLRELYPVKNIAMHGRPTSKFDSRDLWQKYDYKEYGIVSEPYFDIDFSEVLYLTDAGRAWGDKSINLRDHVVSDFCVKINHTMDIIELLKEDKLPKKIMINIHPEHWANSNLQWYQILVIRKIKNYIKRLLID